MSDIIRAKTLLKHKDCSCVLCRGNNVYESCERGIKPIAAFIDNKTELSGFSAADKIVGKAAAMLYVMLGVKAVYGEVMSKSAAEVFKKHGIEYEYGTLTENIINRRGDGLCPMEMAVLNISDAESAYSAIKAKLNEMAVKS